MLCGKIGFSFEKVSSRDKMLTKRLYNLHIYIDADYEKDDFHACVYFVRLHVFICYVNTCLQRVINRWLINPSLSGLCSEPCIERQARTFDIVKTWVFNSVNVHRWSFIDIVVYCNILLSLKPHFLK